MTEYSRAKVKGASYFFTVNCAERRSNHLLVEHIDLLRQVFRKVKNNHPFKIDAIVVLPDHLHCIWSLPPGDPIDAVRKLTASYALKIVKLAYNDCKVRR